MPLAYYKFDPNVERIQDLNLLMIHSTKYDNDYTENKIDMTQN